MASLFARKFKADPAAKLKRLRQQLEEPASPWLETSEGEEWPADSVEAFSRDDSAPAQENTEAQGPREVSDQDHALAGEQERPFSYLEQALQWEEEMGLDEEDYPADQPAEAEWSEETWSEETWSEEGWPETADPSQGQTHYAQGEPASDTGPHDYYDDEMDGAHHDEHDDAFVYDDEDDGDPADSLHVELVPVAHLHPNPRQPRRSFANEPLQELAKSLLQNGMLQPILVRHHSYKVGEYEIVAGERRWRAAEIAGMTEVPVLVRELADNASIEVSIIENLQREDLTPLELAEGYQQLIEEFHHNQEGLARTLGKSRSHVANTLRLLSLPPEVKAMIQDGELSAGHARALVGCDRALSVAQDIVTKGLSVRDAEQLVKQSGDPAQPVKARRRGGETYEPSLSQILGQKVTVSQHGQKGKLTIYFSGQDELAKIVNRLKGDGPVLAATAAAAETSVPEPAPQPVATQDTSETTADKPVTKKAKRVRKVTLKPAEKADIATTPAPPQDDQKAQSDDSLKALAEKYGLPWPLTRNEQAYGPDRGYDDA